MASMPPKPKETSRPLKVQTHTSLPPAKMRALIALYHQAEDWITEENLMERIDQAFVPERASATIDSTGPTKPQSLSYDTIDRGRRTILAAPKMAPWDLTSGQALSDSHHSNTGASWSNNRLMRERKVIEALYGVVVTDKNKLMPGLDIVEEAEEMVTLHRKRDQEQREFEAKQNPIFERSREGAEGQHSSQFRQ
ncbi:hypothetical protein BDN70DRAFT_871441 [Pholiota conissans]|uniref:Uncharacterized protein n=1 Tax=Pholiota conissans TaxID=109636 RepID=A0A9P6CYL2_9AGAR|nr:hypothetical protein BDN70DRAFT_871441 [Pholiota conissans]